jgi:hypothetical protein
MFLILKIGVYTYQLMGPDPQNHKILPWTGGISSEQAAP